MAPKPKRTHRKEPIPGSLGALIRDLRDARGWSQEELAKRSGLDQHDISRVETGKSLHPHELTLVALAEAFGVPLGLLYERSHYHEVSYQIPELRKELQHHGLDSQTVMVHLARIMRENEAKLKGRDPEQIVAFFERAIASLDGANVTNGTAV